MQPELIPRPLLLQREGEKSLLGCWKFFFFARRRASRNFERALPLLFSREGGRGDELRRIIFILTFLLYLPAHSQSQLFISLVRSQGYVVGAQLAASGVHRYEGGQAWTHMGWNNPRVLAMACAPREANVIFLACGNGVARTLDGGKSWRMTTDWRVTEALDIALDTHAPEHVYVATAFGVWTSRNCGETWRESNRGLRKKFAQSIAVDHAQTRRVFAGTEGGLYLSENGGGKWRLLTARDAPILDLEQSAAQPSVWLAATEARGVLLSCDHGKSWRCVEGALAHASIYAVAIDPFNANNMAAASWGEGVFVSNDRGETWQERSEGLPVRNLCEAVFDANHAGRLWVATFEAGVFYSEDLGRKWSEAGMRGAMVFDMVFIPQREGQ